MPAYRFTLTEYDPAKPWVIVSTGRESVELPDDQDFQEWANERYRPSSTALLWTGSRFGGSWALRIRSLSYGHLLLLRT